ncbi:MAG TPA: 3-isopropylmalate dehydratase [Candidatus Omnitrophota bacterium]|nr:3-isopropylmalate dehydratase [Candidatus Omnitrophota bacterium]
MENKISGKVYVLGNDIDTDQIIPAHYLTYNPAIPEERKMFGKYALCGLPEASQGLPFGKIPFVEKDADRSGYKLIVAGKNFGCGSSREHAPLALQQSGIEAVVAEFYARIFFRNSVNGGYLIPFETPARLVEKFKTGEDVELDVRSGILKNKTQNTEFPLKPLGDILPILEAGDIFRYAGKK